MERHLVPVEGGQLEVSVSEPGRTALVATRPFQYFGIDGGPLAAPLAALGQAIIVNPRGTGGSSPAENDDDRSVRQLADDLEVVRGTMGLGRWVVVGQSLGGCVALLHALRHEGSVAGLVLSCATSRGLRDERMSVYHPDNPDNVAVRGALAAGRSSEVRQLVAHRPDLVAAAPSGGISLERQRVFTEELSTLALHTRLHEIAVPTLVVGGRHDRAIPIHHSEELAHGIQDARFVILESSGHFPYLEEPTTYRHVLSEFMAEIG